MRATTLIDALFFADGKAVAEEWTEYTPHWNRDPVLKEFENRRDRLDSFSAVRFTDGTGLIIGSSHEGPHSEITPDVSYSMVIYVVDRWKTS